jgi:GNAT superfamily N-acetyltransferase
MPIKYKDTDENGTETYLLSDNGETIGNIKINLVLRMIMDIFVAEKHRKKGYGTQLIEDAEKRFVQKGIKTISTSPINDEYYGFFDGLCYTIGADGTGAKTLF